MILLDKLSPIVTHQAFISLVIVLGLIAVRAVFVRRVRLKSEILSESQRRWMSRAKNGSVFLIVVSLVAIWWPELQKFALSIAAVAVAVVIATKELILCFSGTVMRAGSGAFSIGDWIEIGTMRGEVIDHNMLSTTIQELDTEHNNYDYTGKTIVLPNSLFLTQPVKNMNFMRRYVFHRFSLVTEPEINVFEDKEMLLERIRNYSEDFMDVGRCYNAYIEKYSGIDIPGPEPRTRITTSELCKNIFFIVLFCPTAQAVALEQKLTRDFMAYYYERKAKGEMVAGQATVASSSL